MGIDNGVMPSDNTRFCGSLSSVSLNWPSRMISRKEVLMGIDILQGSAKILSFLDHDKPSDLAVYIRGHISRHVRKQHFENLSDSVGMPESSNLRFVPFPF